METNKIKAILSAVKYGSLSKAADDLLYTPSALSHMADSLEEELGVKLISRTHSGVMLTEEGEELYEQLLNIIKSEEKLLRSAAEINSTKEHELRIGAYSSVSTRILPEIITEFKKDYPQIKVTITVSDRLRGWLDEGRADVIFGDDMALTGKGAVIITEDPYMAVLPYNCLQKKKSTSIDELLEFRYISTNESLLRNYFDENLFSEVIRIESSDHGAVMSMIAEGVGVSVLPSLAIDRRKYKVRALKLLPKISRNIGFAYNKGAYATKVFAEYIKNKLNLK